MSIWPRWSLEGEPAALAKYVLPDDVAALVHLPGPPASSRIAQTRAVYEALADARITYSHEAPSDEPDRQVIREPGEVLWSPRHATCLDLALIMAGACLHASLHPLVFILDPPEAGRAAHALLGVWIGDPRPDGPQMPQTGVWDTAPEGWLDLVQQDVNRPPRPLLLLDPIGIAHALPTSPIRGARAPFAEAVRAGAEYAAGWDWRLAVDIGRTWRQQDTHTPAGHPKDQPLRSPYVELDPQVHRPLEVLKAEHAVVPFQARDELTVLTHFCRTVAAGQHTGIALIHGVGGAGKTRLALELAERMATREGWYTGYLREGSEGRDWVGAVVSPTLIVLDYAEARAADAQDLLAILKRRTERGAAPAVVVMTARSAAGQWLTTLRKAWQRDGHLCRELPSLELPSEHPDGSAIFRRAVEAFRDEPDSVGLSAAERATPEEWTTLDYILLAFLAARSPGRLPETRAHLYEEVLEHERGYWAQTYQRVTGSTGDAPVDVLNRAVACLTLRAPITRAQSIATLRAVEELADDAKWREAIRITLTDCLQPGPGEPLVLRPDPIADQLTLHELAADPELLNRALDGLDPEPLLDALRQLNRAAAANPDTAADMVSIWISEEPDRWRPMLQIAAEQRGTALTALRQLIDTTPAPPWLDGLSQAIPFTTLGLPDLALHADTRRLTALRSIAGPAPADLAELLQRLSHRQSNTGNREEALASINEAVHHYRNLAQTNPAAFLPDLAGSLNNLSNRQSDTGDRDGALASINEAVHHYRNLAQTNPAAFLPDLAMSLNNLSGCQSDTGDRDGALASINEAVDHYRNLAQTNPAAFLPDFTMSLNNLSNRQSDTGDRDGALASINEAVHHYRNLAQTNPAAFLPDLAMSLNNLSNRQGDTGDRDGALASINEAVEIRRNLAQANPAAFLPNLAMSLNNLSNRQSDTGDLDAALTSINEAVEIRRNLAQADPDAFLPDLALSLNNLSNQQSDNGNRDVALTSINEAVDHYRTLAQANPAAFLPNLATSLNNLSNRQSDNGNREEALTSINEAVEIRRTLAQANPAAFLPDLATSLNNLSTRQSGTGNREEALASINEAVEIHRALAQANPAAFLPNLATSLNNLSTRQSGTGNREEALASINEAVEIRRNLAQANPAAFLPNLALSLNNLSNQQSDNGNRDAALTSINEAVEIHRTLAQANPAAFLPNLAGSLNNLANQQSDNGNRDAALASINEAVDHYRTLAQTNPAAFLPDLATSLNNLSNQQSGTGNPEEALAPINEAVEIHRTLAQANPAAFLPNLAGSLNNLSNQQSNTGNPEEALASINEAVDHYRNLAQTNPAAFLPNLALSLNNLSGCQSDTGDREGALASINEAVHYYRTLAQTNSAAFLPNLALSLNNLSNQQSDNGNPEEALASINEAVDHYRNLAQTNPAAFLPNLAASLNNLSVQQSNTTMPSVVWENAIIALEAHTLAQAELRAHYASYLAEHVGPERAVDQLIHAARGAVAGSPQPLRRARHRIRSVAISHSIDDPRLPDWAIHPLPDESLELLNEWAQASDWPATEAFLRTHADRLQQPDFRHHLRLAAALFPGVQAIDHLTALLAEADARGFGTVLEQGRRDHNQRLLLEAWINTPSWMDSKAFLNEHSTALHAPEIRALIADMDAPVAHHHLAILQLTDRLPHDTVYEIVTDQDTASEYAFHAMDQADVPQLRQILAAHARPLARLSTALFAAVVATADGDTDQARQQAELIAGHGTDVQRRAYAIRLRTLARHNRELAPAGELANLIDPDDNS